MGGRRDHRRHVALARTPALMAVVVKPALVLAACVAAVPAAVFLAAVLTTVWYEKRFLPRICGED